MAFHISDLPASVQALFNKHIHSPALWPIVVQEAVNKGVTDPKKLADVIFYMHHPDLINVGISRSQKNFKKLSDEWNAWLSVVESETGIPGWSKTADSTKTTKPTEWEYYRNSKWSSSNAISETVKDWLAKPPKHEREVGIFKSKLSDGGRPLFFLAWKTLARDTYCRMGHTTGKDGHVTDSGALFGWIEWITSLDGIRKRHKIEYTGMAARAFKVPYFCAEPGREQPRHAYVWDRGCA